MTGTVESEPESGARRWLGYTCPECYAIFRVPVEAQGKVAECPHCELPAVLGRKGQPVVQEEEVGVGEDGKDLAEEGWERSERSGRLKKRKRVQKKRKRQDWEKTASEEAEKEGPLFFLVILVGLLFLIVGVGVFLKGVLETTEVAAHLGTTPEIRIGVLEEGKGEAEEGREELVLGEEFRAEEELKLIQGVVDKFLKAPDLEEMLKYIRDRDRVEKLVRVYYADRLYQTESYRAVGAEGELQFKGDLASVVVELEDYSRKAIALERTPKGFLVDWESWVAWGEMSWDELQTKRPTEPVLMRVRCSKVDYYNFEFIDDRKWRSYRLMSADGEHAVFGYVERNSLQESRVKSTTPDSKRWTLIVRVHFPEGAQRRDQVVIDEVVNAGWILPSSK